MAKANSVIRMFLPKEEKFHELLARDTQNLLRAVRLFAEIAQAPRFEDRRAKAVELKAIEHNGDTITREVFDALNLTFITPFDRDDIRSIAMDLDDILDHVEAAAHCLVLFELDESPAALKQFADILVFMAEESHHTTALVWDMANEKRIHTSIMRISELENQADALYSAVIADLFKDNGRNPIEIMKWKEVYEELEEACDACKDYTHILGNVVVKNA